MMNSLLLKEFMIPQLQLFDYYFLKFNKKNYFLHKIDFFRILSLSQT